MARAARYPETRDVWPRALLLFGAGLLVFLVIAATTLKLIFDTKPFWPPAGTQTTANATSPALQPFPAADLAALRQREDNELRKLAWVDRNAGIARIPIEDAMKLVAAHGLPNWGGPAVAPAREDCVLLEERVPRVPQAENCHGGGVHGAPSERPASQQDNAASSTGGRP